MGARLERRDEDLGALVGRLHFTIANREEPILAGYGLTMWEYIILSGVRDQAPITQSALARFTRRDPTRLSIQVNELSARGLLTRTADEADRRRNLVALTGRGQDLLGVVEVDIRAMESELLRALPLDSQRLLRGLLADVTAGLRPE